jgi:hypothetical protein
MALQRQGELGMPVPAYAKVTEYHGGCAGRGGADQEVASSNWIIVRAPR